MKAVNPYLNFNGNAEEAFEFYKSVFGGEFTDVIRFKDMDLSGMDELPEEELNAIAHIALPLGEGTLLMGSDSPESMGHPLTTGDNFYIHLGTESAEEGERLFSELSAGGQITMPFQRTEWAEKFGMCADKFGAQWMVDYTGEENA